MKINKNLIEVFKASELKEKGAVYYLLNIDGTFSACTFDLTGYEKEPREEWKKLTVFYSSQNRLFRNKEEPFKRLNL